MSSVDIDLTRLPAPQIIEPLDYETILAEQKADLISRYPDCQPLLALESEPLLKQLEVSAYRELLLRQRVNDSCRGLLLALATGGDLDHIGVTYYHAARLETSPGDAMANPPIAATYETDEIYRARLAMAPEGYSVAGPTGAYEWLARSASTEVLDAQAVSPSPGEVDIYVLSSAGDGTPSADLLAMVSAALSATDVRPMCDKVTVKPATIINYQVSAVIYVYDRPSGEMVLRAALDSQAAYRTKNKRMGYDITTSGLIAALFVPGVQRVELIEPSADVVCGDGESSYCTAVDVTIGGTAQ